MKKTIACLAVLAGAAMLALTSCKGKDKKEEPAPQVQPEPPAPPKPVLSYVPAVALYSPGALYKPDKDDDGLMIWSRSVNCGTRLEAYSYSDSGVETKTAVRIVNKEKQERNFVHVRYSGDDYWIQDVTVALKARPGVVTENDAFIYKEADIKSMTSTSLPFGTIVAVSEDAGDGKFACISVDTEKETFHDVYVKTGIIGGDKELTILALATAIEGAQSEVLRDELADALGKLSSSSDLVNERKDNVLSKAGGDALWGLDFDPTLPGVYAQGSLDIGEGPEQEKEEF
jgi:hypothetical protein